MRKLAVLLAAAVVLVAMAVVGTGTALGDENGGNGGGPSGDRPCNGPPGLAYLMNPHCTGHPPACDKSHGKAKDKNPHCQGNGGGGNGGGPNCDKGKKTGNPHCPPGGGNGGGGNGGGGDGGGDGGGGDGGNGPTFDCPTPGHDPEGVNYGQLTGALHEQLIHQFPEPLAGTGHEVLCAVAFLTGGQL